MIKLQYEKKMLHFYFFFNSINFLTAHFHTNKQVSHTHECFHSTGESIQLSY